MYYDKLAIFFKNKGLKQKEVAVIMGYSPTMIGRYLKGSDKINADFITKLIQEWPEIDLQYIFSQDKNIPGIVSEPETLYKKEQDVIVELEFIEKKIYNIKRYLAQKSHKKKK